MWTSGSVRLLLSISGRQLISRSLPSSCGSFRLLGRPAAAAAGSGGIGGGQSWPTRSQTSSAVRSTPWKVIGLVLSVSRSPLSFANRTWALPIQFGYEQTSMSAIQCGTSSHRLIARLAWR
jgi:hypothetical protein